jgi:uncharacterized protein YerC
MAQISKYPTSKHITEKLFETFFQCFIYLSHSSNTQKFLFDLLTPTERIMLAKRIFIALMLMKDFEYSDIRQTIKVSNSTIASVRQRLEDGNDGLNQILNKIIRNKELNQFFMNMSLQLVTPLARSGMGSGPWRHLKSELIKSKKHSSF